MLLGDNNDIMSDESAANAFWKHFGSIYVNDDGNMPKFVNNVRLAFNDDLIDFSVVRIEKVVLWSKNYSQLWSGWLLIIFAK
jgi:hypothetical protein